MLPEKLKSYFDDFSLEFKVYPISSNVPDTELWLLIEPIGLAQEDDKSVFLEDHLHVPREFSRWFALVRIWSLWLAPRHRKGYYTPTENTVLCLFLR